MQILDEDHSPAAVAPRLQPLVRWLAWPSGLAAAAAASWLLTRDAALAMPLQMATMLAALMIVVLAERIVPFRCEWQRAPSSERRTDFTSMAVLMALADPLVKLALLPLIASATVALAGTGEGLGWHGRPAPLAPRHRR